MKFGSVCSGIEAASVAWYPLGWQAAFYSEIDKFPCAVLKHHYPDVPLHGDFTTIQDGAYDAIDLLVGGTPCQAFSVAGLRKGFSDERGNLTLEFVRLAQRLRPRWLVWENVPGVLSIDGGRAFGSFLGGLEQCGYGFAYRILDAQYFGVPQRRRRVFVVGCLGDWRPAAQVLFERESLCGDITPSRGAEEEVAGTFKARAGSGGWGQDVDLASGGYMRPVETAKCLTSRGAGCGNRDLETSNVVIALAGNSIDRQPHNGANGTGYDESGVAYTLTKMDRHAVAYPINTQIGLRGEASNSVREGIGLGDAGDPAFTLQSSHGHAVAFAQNQLGEIREGEVFNTLNTNSNASGRNTPLVRETMQVRRLTPLECERLQGFPDHYTKISDKTADGPRYKAIGNSMAVPVMRWIGKRINIVNASISSTSGRG